MMGIVYSARAPEQRQTARWLGGTTPRARQGNTAASQIEWLALPFCGCGTAVARRRTRKKLSWGGTGGDRRA
jgi:hypothetical protein